MFTSYYIVLDLENLSVALPGCRKHSSNAFCICKTFLDRLPGRFSSPINIARDSIQV